MNAGETTNFKAVDVTLLVFGGMDDVTGTDGCEDAFAEAFSVERNERSWETVGAAPSTVKCLESNKVRINKTDPNFGGCETIEAANHNATSTSTAKGFDVELMKVVSNRAAFEGEGVTVPFTKELVEGIASAKTAGQFFRLHKGVHFTCDNVFKALELKERGAVSWKSFRRRRTDCGTLPWKNRP